MNQKEYIENAHYWAQLLQNIVQRSSSADWQPWLNTDYTNYAPGDDSIVIFSIFSPTRARGLSVQQRLDLPYGRPYVAMHSRIACRETGHPIKHLIVDCSRHPVHEAFICEAAKLWLLSEIESFFCSTEGPRNK